MLALSKILGPAKLNMTEKYAHFAPDHLRNEIARTEVRPRPWNRFAGNHRVSG